MSFLRLLGMQKYMKGWCCTACRRQAPMHINKQSEIGSCLFGGKMKNSDCRAFLHIKRQTATRILQGMNLRLEGANRNRTYSMFIE